MNSDLIKALKAGISDLLIRHPLYRFRKEQEDHDRLRVLLAHPEHPRDSSKVKGYFRYTIFDHIKHHAGFEERCRRWNQKDSP